MNQPQLEIDDLAAVVRQSIAAQKKDDAPARLAQTASRESGSPQLKLQSDFQPSQDHRYHINELLRYHDLVFVQAAYRAVLKRSPDETELLRELKRLRSGDINKIDLLADLRFSCEGRGKGVQLEGLIFRSLIRRIGQLPLIGYPIRLAIAFVRLPNLVRDQREFAGYVLAQQQQIADFINGVSVGLSDCRDEVLRLQETLSKRVDTLAESISQQQAATNAQLSELDQELNALIASTTEEFARLRFQMGDFSDPKLDPLYAALEDRFRGSRAEIKERFRDYLPYVNANSPVLDLGCGRGEWLELLTENGIEARGVDTNRVQVAQCRAGGLPVTEEDFLLHLQNAADASVGTITGFHIIEHLSFNALIMLLDEVLRVLRPGGVVIFETPNPENVTVGSNFFYLDPTHRHPLPHELMEFLFKSHGFHDIEVLPLHPWDSGPVAEEGKLAERFNGFFFGPMDYAIVGRKVDA